MQKKLIPNQSFLFPLQSQSDTWLCPRLVISYDLKTFHTHLLFWIE